MKTFNKTFILLTLLYVLFFVKTWGSVSGNIYSHDDVVYYAQTASLVNDFDIDIKNNLGPYSNIYLGISPETGRIMSYQPLGATLLYLVPYAAAKPVVLFISIIREVPFDQYDPLFFVILCFFTLALFYISGVFIRKTLKLFFERDMCDIVTTFVLWGTILPVYVFRRPIFGVVPEFFLASLLVYFLAKICRQKSISLLQSAFLGFLTGLLILTRWNDIYFLLLSLVCLVWFSLRESIVRLLAKAALFMLTAGILFSLQIIVWEKNYGSIQAFMSYYCQLHAQFLNSQNTALQYLKNLFHLLFGLDWGIIFTMPILLFGGVAFIVKPKLEIFTLIWLRRVFFTLLFWVSFHVVLKWKNTGEFYGYRFLISLLPLCGIGFATLIAPIWLRYKKIITGVILLFCLINFFVILPFEFTEKTTLLPNNITPMGGAGWGNNAYVMNAVKFYFDSNMKILISNFSRGFLAASFFGLLYSLGIDLQMFSSKVKTYFSLSGYRQYTSFVYLFLTFLFLYLIKIKNGK